VPISIIREVILLERVHRVAAARQVVLPTLLRMPGQSGMAAAPITKSRCSN
jgi:hypothetical protein